MPASASWQLPPSIKIEHSQQVEINVKIDEIARSAVPATLFGFNIPWMNFQRGYWRNQHVRPEIIEWLKPFAGAVYRYPGGEVSNWFEWEKSVGPLASREKQHTTFGQYTKAEFGFDEFLDFVKAVNGVPLVTANLKGTKNGDWDDEDASKNNVEWLKYAIQKEGSIDNSNLPYCQVGKKCPVHWWELGNELDWGNDAWSADRYITRARAVGNAMLAVDPSIKLIAQTATAPWDHRYLLGKKSDTFNEAISQALTPIAKGYAYHCYYDGMSIPTANHFLENTINSLSKSPSLKSPTIFITEHARWPEKPAFGDWKENWAQTGNLGGAISTADFLLSQAMIPNVQGAMWHALGAWGPWQLFYVSQHNDHIYPSVAYWGLRVLRIGLLDQALKISVSSSNENGYRGGYDVRAVFMKQGVGKRYSLMTINRANNEQNIRLNIPEWANRSFNARQYYITGASKNDANTEDQENRVVMQERSMMLRFDAKGQAVISLPALSVSSVLFEPKIGT